MQERDPGNTASYTDQLRHIVMLTTQNRKYHLPKLLLLQSYTKTP